MSLEEEKQKALLDAARTQALMAARASQRRPNEAMQFASGFNKSLIGAAGILPDLVGKGLEKVGLEVGRPFGGTERLTEGAQELGMLKTPGTPETAGERAGQIVGASVLAAAPVGIAGQGLQKGKSIFEPIIQTFREAPRTFAALEGASTVTAIAGGEAARGVCPEGVPESTCAILGEIAGGVSGPAVAKAGGKIVEKLPSVRIAKNIFKQLPIIGKDTSRREAADVVQDFAGGLGPARTITRQAAEFDALPGTQFTFAELAGDDNLLLFQEALKKSSPDVAAVLSARRAATNEAIKNNLQSFNGQANRVESLKDFYDLRFQQLNQALDERMAVSVDNMNKKIQALSPEVRRRRASIIMNDELVDALKDARKQESVVWNQADPEEAISLGTSRNVFDDAIGLETDIPEFVRKFFKGKRIKVKRFKDVKEFRTRMNRFREDMRRQGNFSSSHFLGELDDAIMDDVGRSAISGEVSNAVRFSRELNERFTRGPIGQVLRFSSRGGRAVQPGEIGEELFPSNPIKASQGVEATRRATTPIEGQPQEQIIANTVRRQEVFRATKETIKNRLFKDTGEFDINAAKSMLEKKGEFINNFPTLKTAIKDAVENSNAVETLRKNIDEGLKTATDARKSALGIVLKAGDNVDQIMPNILRSSNRKTLMSQAVRDVQGNPDAFAGLQDSYLNQLYNTGLTSTLDDTGRNILSGRQLSEFHTRFLPDIKSSGLFNSTELKRIDTIINNARRIDNVLGSTKSAEAILKDNTRMIDDLIVRIIGANLTAPLSKTTGAGLVVAQAGSNFARTIAEKLPQKSIVKILNEAVKEPELFRDLMTEVTTPALAEKVGSRLHAWMVALGIEVPDLFEGINPEKDANALATEIQ